MIKIIIKSDEDTDLVGFANKVADSIARDPLIGYNKMFIKGDSKYVGSVHHSFGGVWSKPDILIKIKQPKPTRKATQ